MLHGDELKQGVQQKTRQRVIDCIAASGGKVIDTPYTQGFSSSMLNQKLKEVGTTPEVRMKLKQSILNSSEELDIFASTVNPVRLKNNPVYLSEEVLRSLYADITK